MLQVSLAAVEYGVALPRKVMELDHIVRVPSKLLITLAF
jgi:hypothetical protein